MNWNDFNNKKPLAYKTGDWDGKKSDKILVYTRIRSYYVVEMYEDILNGSVCYSFYEEGDFEVENITHWIEIDSPF